MTCSTVRLGQGEIIRPVGQGYLLPGEPAEAANSHIGYLSIRPLSLAVSWAAWAMRAREIPTHAIMLAGQLTRSHMATPLGTRLRARIWDCAYYYQRHAGYGPVCWVTTDTT